MVKAKVYLKTGQSFDVVAVVQLQDDEGENDAVD